MMILMIYQNRSDKNMSDDKNKNPNMIPKPIINLLVSDLLRKNGINVEKTKEQLSEEQRQMIKELVNDLTSQVESFVKSSSAEDKRNTEK